MPCHAMHPIKYLFLESVSYAQQFDMHSYVEKKFILVKMGVTPFRVVSLTDFLAQLISTLCLLNQSIPRMTSMPFDSKIMRLVTKSTPLILRFNFGHSCLVGISPPRELTII
jgi:hypothetical protein